MGMQMGELLPQDRQIWVRAFYGFNPEEAGYIGFTHEAQREDMLTKMRDGDLALIYGAVDFSLTPICRGKPLASWKSSWSDAMIWTGRLRS